jgi:hypothetical protein
MKTKSCMWKELSVLLGKENYELMADIAAHSLVEILQD